MEANDNDLGWELLPKEDGLYLLVYTDEFLINLGPKEQAMEKLANFLAQQDFGE